MKAFWFLTVSALLFFAAPMKALAADSKPAVAVELVVGDLQGKAQYYSYMFPDTPTYYTRYATFRLTNNAHYPISVDNVSLYGQAYSFSSDCWGYLGPHQSCFTQVAFRPFYQGYFTGQLNFCLSSGNVLLDLSGWGVNY